MHRSLHMEYSLKRESTSSGIGFFGCSPAIPLTPPQALAHIKTYPNDEFMRRFILRMLESMELQDFAGLVEQAVNDGPDAFRALICEACLSHAGFNGFASRFEKFGMRNLARLTPLTMLQAEADTDRQVQRQWAVLLEDSLLRHEPFAATIASGLAAPCEAPESMAKAGNVSLDRIEASGTSAVHAALPPLPNAAETAATARERLDELDVFHDAEHRHEASLSPVALLREWELDLDVKNGTLNYSLSGIQTSYGKGLQLDTARASLYMEIVERVSSFASVADLNIMDRQTPMPLLRGSRTDLEEQGRMTLNLDNLGLDTPYNGQKVHWLAGKNPDGKTVWVPAQLVFLFCNLDEPSLGGSPDSTGLASGNIMEQARLSGLYEVLERDAEAVGLFDASRCFRLKSSDPAIGPLLADYRDKGIDVVVHDLTTDLGVPSYKVFVRTESGELCKGTGTSLSSRSALLSALLETMYPYPNGQPSKKGPDNLPMRTLEDLPEYGTGHPAGDLRLLEILLTASGLAPVYVDLTRRDLQLPVCRAFVPGLSQAADFSAYTRIHPRQFQAVQRMMNRKK